MLSLAFHIYTYICISKFLQPDMRKGVCNGLASYSNMVCLGGVAKPSLRQLRDSVDIEYFARHYGFSHYGGARKILVRTNQTNELHIESESKSHVVVANTFIA